MAVEEIIDAPYGRGVPLPQASVGMLVRPSLFAQRIIQAAPLCSGNFGVRQVTVLRQKRRDAVKRCQVLLCIFLRGGKAEGPRDKGLVF